MVPLITGACGLLSKPLVSGKPDSFKASIKPGTAIVIDGSVQTHGGRFKGVTVTLKGPSTSLMNPSASTLRLLTPPPYRNEKLIDGAFFRIDANTLEASVPDFELPAGSTELGIGMRLPTTQSSDGQCEVVITPHGKTADSFSNKVSIHVEDARPGSFEWYSSKPAFDVQQAPIVTPQPFVMPDPIPTRPIDIPRFDRYGNRVY